MRSGALLFSCLAVTLARGAEVQASYDGGQVEFDIPPDVPVPKDGAGSLEDLKARPWLGTVEGCLVWNPDCVRFGEAYAGYLLDTTDDTPTNETRCLHRASEFHAWCGNDMVNRTAAVFLQTGAMEVYPPFGCAIWQRGCPNVEKASALEGIFFDEYDDAFMNETRCLQRALDFRVYCHPVDSPETVSSLYAPTAKHFQVSRMSPSARGAGGVGGGRDVGLAAGAVDAEAGAFEVVSGGGGAEEKEEDDEVGEGGAHSLEVNATTRHLWPVARAPPAFASTAMPLALFDLAGEYLDCRRPPLPEVDGTDPARTARYHCNGPQAALAAEALGVYLAVVPDHADAHYNRAVAFYGLTALDAAVGCLVACLKLDPTHSLALGALATVLTQQGRFDEAWALLDARIRPKLPSELIDNPGGGGPSSETPERAEPEAPAAEGKKQGEEEEKGESATAATKTKKSSWWRFGKEKKRGGKGEKGGTTAEQPIKLQSSSKKKPTAVKVVGAEGGTAANTVAKQAAAGDRVSGAAILPAGVAAPELVAWARLASRFGQGGAAVAVLRAFIDRERADASAAATAAFSGEGGEAGEGRDDDEEALRHPGVDPGVDESAASDAVGSHGMYASASLARQLEASMRFRLAWLLDAQARPSEAWGELRQANALVRSLDPAHAPHLGIGVGAALGQMAALRAAFCAECLRGDRIPSVSGPPPRGRPTPLFVVGMPRSGTTLLEQMLAMHPFIEAAGEVPSLAVLSPRLFIDRAVGPSSASFDGAVTPADMDAIAERFTRTLEHHAGVAGRTPAPRYIVSKLPNHFEMVGLIAKLFPGAPILHATRDARDVLVSNYQTNYQLGHKWSYNLTDAVRYFAGYRSIMRHWEAAFGDGGGGGGDGGGGDGDDGDSPPPLNLLEVRYEDVVCDPAGVASSLAAWLRVPFDAAMASPHLHGRTAHTSSNEQVRRPVYTSSVGRWRAFAAAGGDAGGEEGDEEKEAEEARAALEAALGEGGHEDLEAGSGAAGFPGAEILGRLLAFEPPAARGDPATWRDLARTLPCSPKGAPEGGSGAADARWPGTASLERV